MAIDRDSVAWKGLMAGALLGLALLAYRPALAAGFIWDDDHYVTDNVLVRSPAGLPVIWLEPSASPQYYPLVYTSFWIEYQLRGGEPFGYHLVNVILHALNAILLWQLLTRLAVPAAWFIAAVFVLHPVHVESVAWVTERKNVLSGFFYLAAALAYFRFAPPDPEPAPVPYRWAWYALALILFLAALLSKTVTSSLPAALLLVLWWKRSRLAWRDVLELLPFLVVGACLGLHTAWIEKVHVGAVGPDWDLSFVDRFLIAGRALWFYAGKLVWPTELSFNYPRWHVDPSAPREYVYPVTALAVPVIFWLMRHRLGRGPLVGVLFFGGTLFPALGFFNTYPMQFSFVADHFQYLASIGLIATLVAGADTLLQPPNRMFQVLVRVAAAIYLAFLGLQTYAQSYIYTDKETLWRDTLAKNPDSHLAHMNLGSLLLDDGRLDEALLEFREADRLHPGDPILRYDLGVVYWQHGDLDRAIAELEESVRLDPRTVSAQVLLGEALRRRGKLGDAVTHFEAALARQPDLAGAHHGLALALVEQGKPRDAIRHFEAVLRANPNDDGVLLAAAETARKAGDSDKARQFEERAAKLGGPAR
jgi:Tfp pilus assembly protein PilF